MEIKEILRTVDHTLLKPEATLQQILTLCDEGLHYGVASVCIPPSFVHDAAAHLAGRLPVCTVIGFPNGYASTATKAFEAFNAVMAGAQEIDMVVNIGWIKDGRYDAVLEEIRAVKEGCDGRLLKVIIETCKLSQDEKLRMCQVVSQSGADFIKTSTGFGGGGATREDVALLRAHTDPRVKVKAAGGIRTLQDAEDFLRLGADRLGTSSVVKAVQTLEKQ